MVIYTNVGALKKASFKRLFKLQYLCNILNYLSVSKPAERLSADVSRKFSSLSNRNDAF